MSPRIEAARSALVLVDYQARLLPSIQRGPHALAEAVRLADVARELGIRVVGTEQNPAGLGPNAPAIRERCEATLAKMHFDGCEDGLTDLLRNVDGELPSDIVVAGCETHVCLMQTALGLAAAGFRTWVAANACGSRHAEDHALAIERLRGAGIVPVSVEMVAFEWLRSCAHERFRPVLAILKQPRG